MVHSQSMLTGYVSGQFGVVKFPLEAVSTPPPHGSVVGGWVVIWVVGGWVVVWVVVWVVGDCVVGGWVVGDCVVGGWVVVWVVGGWVVVWVVGGWVMDRGGGVLGSVAVRTSSTEKYKTVILAIIMLYIRICQ